MGIYPAPFWANLYLHRYECEFTLTQISSDITLACQFHGCAQFINMCCLINDMCYPEELEQECEHNGNHATFLDLDITIEDGVFMYKLYDKRDEFPFHIIRMPD